MRLPAAVLSIFAGLFWLCASDVTDKFPPWNAAFLVTFNRGDPTDRSWTASNGTLTSGASIGNDTFCTFDGTDDYVDFGANAAHAVLPISVSLWFNTLSQDQVAYATMVGKYVSASFNGWFIFMDTSERVVGFYSRDASNYTGGDIRLLSPASYKDSSWHQMVMVAESSGSSLYIDGALVDTDTWTGTQQATTSAANLRLGAHTASGFRWKGTLDDVTVYQSALTANQVGAMFAEGRQ